jgi:DNA-binding response OmpR family regulator
MDTSASILVIDDQDDVLVCTKQVLESAGYGVLTADSAIEALTLLRSQPVDLILADIAMPHMNGYQLHEQVIANPRWVAIPFLFLSGRSLDSDVRYGKALGVDDYLVKPVKPQDLVAAVGGRLRRARQLARSHAELGGAYAERHVLALGRLRLDIDQHRVWFDEEEVPLSAREFSLLAYLAEQASHVVTLPDLVQITHNLATDHAEAGSLLRPLIRSIRRKLGYPSGQMGCIESVRGVGYRLIPPRA